MKRALFSVIVLLSLALPAFAQQDILKSSTGYPLTFLMIDSSDHITGKTGLSPTVTISKAGGSFGSPSGSVTEISSGWYKVAGNATDTNTDGEILLHATGTGADPTDMKVGVVVDFDPRSVPTVADVVAALLNEATSGHTTAGTVGKKIGSLPDATAGASGGLFIAGTNAATTITSSLTTTFTGNLTGSIGSIANNAITAASIASDADTEIENSVLNAALSSHTTAGSVGKGISDGASGGDPWSTSVPAAYGAGTAGYIIGNNIKPSTTIQKGLAFANFPIWMLSSSGAAQTGLSTSQISCQYSLDGGGWSALADTTEVEIGLGKYVVDLSSAETNGNSFSILCTGPSGTQPYRTVITPQR